MTRVVHTSTVSFWIDERRGYTSIDLRIPGRSVEAVTSIHLVLTPEETGRLCDALKEGASA